MAPDAPWAEVKRAYRRAALAHHPDQNSDPHAARHFRRITEAYKILEARARLKEPPKARTLPLGDRVSFVLGDIRALVRRWPADRWTRVVDGLPAAVWVASALEVLARAWPGAPSSSPVVPSVEGIASALDGWPDRMAAWPLPPGPGPVHRALGEAVRAAEKRLTALERPARR